MSHPLTARELLDEIRKAKDAARLAVEEYRAAIADTTRTEHDFKLAYASAFTKAKEDGATDSLAKQLAILSTSELSKAAGEAVGRKRETYAWWDTCQKIVEAHAAASYALNQELKLERTS